MTEHDLRRALRAAVVSRRQAGAPLWLVKIHGGPYQEVGIPDWLGCAAGRFVAIETKSVTGQLTPAQRLHLDRIQAAGGQTLVETRLAPILAWLDALAGAGPAA